MRLGLDNSGPKPRAKILSIGGNLMLAFQSLIRDNPYWLGKVLISDQFQVSQYNLTKVADQSLYCRKSDLVGEQVGEPIFASLRWPLLHRNRSIKFESITKSPRAIRLRFNGRHAFHLKYHGPGQIQSRKVDR